MNNLRLWTIVAIFSFGCIFMGCERKAAEQPAPGKAAELGNAAKAVKKPPARGDEHWIKLSEEDKQYLIRLARKAFEFWVKEERRYQPEDLPAHLKDMKVNRVFATLYKKGEWRGCVSSKGKTIAAAVIGSVVNTCRDQRFENPRPDELNDFRVELSFLQPFELIETKDPALIEKELEPGVHGISVRHSSGKQAFFLPYVFVKKQRTTLTWLERICKKAGMKKEDWKSEETYIYRYGTINFIEEKPNGRSVDLYRYKVELDEMAPDAAEKAVKLSLEWFANHRLNEKMRFAVGYDADHKPIRKDSEILQLMGLTALGRAEQMELLPKSLKDTLDWRLADGVESLELPPQIQGAENLEKLLLTADLLVATPKKKAHKEMAKAVAEYLRTRVDLEMSLPDEGSYVRSLPNYLVKVFADLVALTDGEENKAYLEQLYTKVWKRGKPLALEAIARVNMVLGDEGSKEKMIELLKGVMGSQYTVESAPYRDYTGAFDEGQPPTTVGLAHRLSGVAIAYSRIGDDEIELKALALQTMMFALRCLLEQQFTETSAFYFESYHHSLGAFKRDILINTSRLDDTSAALQALLDVKKWGGKELIDKIGASKEGLHK